MEQNRPLGALVVSASLLVAMMLRVVPLPKELFIYNPDWVLLFLIYWTMAIPDRVGVVYAWCVGLFCDVLTGRMLGQHPLAYALVAYICVRLYRRLRLYPMSQQMFSVLLLLLLNQLLIFWTQNIKAPRVIGLAYWFPSLIGALVWPTVFLMLRRVRRHYQIF